MTEMAEAQMLFSLSLPLSFGPLAITWANNNGGAGFL